MSHVTQMTVWVQGEFYEDVRDAVNLMPGVIETEYVDSFPG